MLRALLLLLAAFAIPATAATTATSPDGRLAVSIATDNDGRPNWSLTRDGKTVIAPSRLGFILADAPKLERNFAITGQSTRSNDATWEQPWGEQRLIRDHHVEFAVKLAGDTPLNRAVRVVFRLFDDGLLVRATGDIIALSPPLIVEEAQIDAMVAAIANVLETIS